MHENLSASHRIGQLSTWTLGVRPLPLAFAPLQLPCARASPLHLIAIVNDAISAHPHAQAVAGARADDLPAHHGPLPHRHDWDGRRRALGRRKGLLRVLFWRPVSRSVHAAGEYVKVRTFVGPQNPVDSVPDRAPRANRSH